MSHLHVLTIWWTSAYSGWDVLASLRHPCKFQRVSLLGSVNAHHSNSGRQPNFAALNRGRHLYSTGRPSRWASAHILVYYRTWDVAVWLFDRMRATGSNAKFKMDARHRRRLRCAFLEYDSTTRRIQARLPSSIGCCCWRCAACPLPGWRMLRDAVTLA